MDGTLLNKKYKLEDRVTALEEGGGYELPIASASTLGGVKIGENLQISESGVLSASGGVKDYSTTEQATGQKWIDGKEIYSRVLHFEQRKVLSTGENRDIIAISDDIDFVQAWAIDYGQKFVQNQLQIGIDLGNLYIYNAASKSIGITDLVLYYTKNEVTKKRSSKKTVE